VNDPATAARGRGLLVLVLALFHLQTVYREAKKVALERDGNRYCPGNAPPIMTSTGGRWVYKCMICLAQNPIPFSSSSLSSHLLIFSSSHLLIFSSSHLLIFSAFLLFIPQPLQQKSQVLLSINNQLSYF
jgi:hypothetical protein